MSRHDPYLLHAGRMACEHCDIARLDGRHRA
jgi:hypothetical protein